MERAWILCSCVARVGICQPGWFLLCDPSSLAPARAQASAEYLGGLGSRAPRPGLADRTLPARSRQEHKMSPDGRCFPRIGAHWSRSHAPLLLGSPPPPARARGTGWQALSNASSPGQAALGQARRAPPPASLGARPGLSARPWARARSSLACALSQRPDRPRLPRASAGPSTAARTGQGPGWGVGEGGSARPPGSAPFGPLEGGVRTVMEKCRVYAVSSAARSLGQLLCAELGPGCYLRALKAPKPGRWDRDRSPPGQHVPSSSPHRCGPAPRARRRP